MAGRVKRPKVVETPSERFERVAKKALERGRRAREGGNAKAGRRRSRTLKRLPDHAPEFAQVHKEVRVDPSQHDDTYKAIPSPSLVSASGSRWASKVLKLESS